MATISIHERRRRAPGHYYANADNARFSSHLLSVIGVASSTEAADAIGYNGSTSIALAEAVRREMSLAMELIIKAVIAQRLENGESLSVASVPMSHNIPTLWKQARLPSLDEADQKRLQALGVIMTWAGRYAAPVPAKEDNPDFSYPVTQVGKIGDAPLLRLVSVCWDDFDRIYQIAQRTLWHLSPTF